VLTLRPADRLLLFAPHPDDESVAMGGMIALARSRGVPLRVVYLTDGDNNPWAQRATERRIFIGSKDRERFGRLRRKEAIAALTQLGPDASSAVFLGFPDQGLTRLLMTGDASLSAAVAEQVAQFGPTVVVTPSLLDRHPDHNALAAVAALALPQIGEETRGLRHLRFLVHNPTHSAHRPEEAALALDASERATKRSAIAKHRSQLFWRGEWLLSFAGPQELYLTEEPRLDLAAHPVRRIDRTGSRIAIEISSESHLRAFGRRSIYLLANAPGQLPVRLAVLLPRRGGRARILDSSTGATCGEASFLGHHGQGLVELDDAHLRGATELLAKVEHRFGFFDEAGWKPLLVPGPTTRSWS
jgi:LmbE family N-acetylglucosaminyl deacetylase